MKTHRGIWALGKGMLLVLACCLPVQAREATLNVTRLPQEFGLSALTPRAILQDRAGFLWFGTEDGLYKYDGYTAKKQNGLGRVAITALYQDDSGVIWLGAKDGLHKFDKQTGKSSVYRHQGDNAITALTGDAQGRLWVGAKNGVNAFQPSANTWTPYLFDADITALLKDQQGNLWIGSTDGLHRFDEAQETFQRFLREETAANGLTSNKITALAEQGGLLWIGTADGGVNRLNPADGTWAAFRHDAKNAEADALSSDAITAIRADREGFLWIGTADAGVNRLNPQTGAITVYKNQSQNPRSLGTNAVASLFQDEGGVIWIGLEGQGASKFHPNAMLTFMQRYAQDPLQPPQNSLSGSFVTAALEDRDGMLWVGTTSGLNQIDQRTGDITQYHHKEGDDASLSDDGISSLLEDHSGHLWIGTWQNGLNCFNKATKQFTKYVNNLASPTPTLSDNRVSALYEDRAGFLWIGTRSGLNRFDPRAKTFMSYSKNLGEPQRGPVDNRISAIVQDSQNIFWIGTWHGLSRFDPERQTFTHYYADQKNPNALAFERISAIYEDSQKTLWIATWPNGLHAYRPDSDDFAKIGAERGLAGKSIRRIVEDNASHLWFSTDAGLSCLDLQTKSVTNYDERDGVQAKGVFGGDLFVNQERTLFLGGSSGLSVIYTDRLLPKTYVPRIALTGFMRYTHDGKQESLPIPENLVFELSSRDAGYSFEFAASDYADPASNQYEYTFEKEWVNNGTKRTIEEFNRGIGEYTYQIRGSNNEGVSDDHNMLTVRVSVLPLWWETTWTRVVFALIGIVVISAAPVTYSISQRRARIKIEAAREQAERRAEVLRVVNDVGRRMTSKIPALEKISEKDSKKEIEKDIFEEMCKPIVAWNPTMYIARYDPVNQRISFPVSYKDKKREEYPSRIVEIDDSQKGGLTEEVIRRRKPLNLSHVEQFCKERGLTLPVPPIPKSWLGVPIMFEETVLGVMTLLNDEIENAYSQDEEDALSALTAQAAIAIENARLYNQVVQQVAKLETVNAKLEEANLRIAEKQDMLTRSIIASDFVHRLNNLAGTIPIWVDMISEELGQQPQELPDVQSYLKNIQDDTDKLLRAAEQLKDAYQETSIDLASILQSMLRQVRVQYHNDEAAGRLRIDVKIAPDLRCVRGRSILSDMINNVIDNAVEAILKKGNGELSVSASNERDAAGMDWVKIAVRDTGVGIPKEYLPQIFTIFFSTKGEGRGYGLWRAKAVIENANGTIEAESEEGIGSIFTILLPAETPK